MIPFLFGGVWDIFTFVSNVIRRNWSRWSFKVQSKFVACCWMGSFKVTIEWDHFLITITMITYEHIGSSHNVVQNAKKYFLNLSPGWVSNLASQTPFICKNQ